MKIHNKIILPPFFQSRALSLSPQTRWPKKSRKKSQKLKNKSVNLDGT